MTDRTAQSLLATRRSLIREKLATRDVDARKIIDAQVRIIDADLARQPKPRAITFGEIAKAYAAGGGK